MLLSIEAAKATLDDLLSQDLSAMRDDADLVDKIVELAQIVAQRGKPLEWEQLRDKIQAAFQYTEADLAKLFNVAARAPAVTPAPAEVPFEALIPADGWFGEYLKYVRESEAPAQFHFGAVAACVSSALGRRPLLDWQAKRTFANLYVLLIGPTGSRKSTAIEMARGVVHEAMGDRLNSLADEGSPQGIAQRLYRRWCETNTSSDGIVIASELSVLLGEDKYKQDLSKWLTDWYDCKDSWDRAIRDGFILENLYVCMLGGSNVPWLKRLPASAVTGGFFPRALMLDAPGKRHAHPDPTFDPAERTALVEQLRANLAVVPETLPLTAPARSLMKSWYMDTVDPQERAAHDEMQAAWFSRKLPAALKLAAVWQLADGGPHGGLELKWFDLARGVVDWIDAAVMRVYSSLAISRDGEVVDAVLTLIRKEGGRLAQSTITRRLRNRWRAGHIMDALRTLALSRMVRQVSNPVEGAVWEEVLR